MTNDIIHPEDKEIFLKTLNHKGFLLEDKTWKILEGKDNLSSLSRNKVIEYFNERIEIDFIFVSGDHHLVIECKRTDYSWIFPKARERPNTLNLIFDSTDGMGIKTRTTSDFKTAWWDIAVMFKDDNRLCTRNDLGKTSYKDVHDHIKQVLKETEAYLSTDRFFNKTIMPTIVTNAKLYFLEYSKGDIDSNGNLIDFTNMEEIEGIVYNFPEVMRWDKKRQVISNVGNSISQDHVKSVFIVNINHLDSFISKMMNHYYEYEIKSH